MSNTDVIYRLTLSAPPHTADAFARAIEDHVDSVAWTAAEGVPTARVTGFASGPPDRGAIGGALAVAAAALGVTEPRFTVDRIPVRDWAVENIKEFPPAVVGRFFIHGAEFDGPVPAAKIPLRIPAGGAFGSGDHGSTKGCLVALDRFGHRRVGRALDMGCGSGILAVAIAKMWRAPVLAADIDPTAVRISTANVRANGVARHVRVFQSRGYRHPALAGRRFDLIVANILARPLMRMAGDLARHLAPGGIAILAGLLESDGNMVLDRHRAQGLRLVARIDIDGWRTLVLANGHDNSSSS